MTSPIRRKIAATVLLLLLSLLTWIGTTEQVLRLAGYGFVQDEAHGYLMDVRGRALEVYLAARTADGLLALMESVQVGPVVAEARPGMVLDPIREVMDHLGTMMAVSVISVEALDIVRRVGTRISFAAIIPFGLVLLAAGVWLRIGRFSVSSCGQGVLVIGVVMTLGLPVAVCAEKLISKTVIETEFGVAYQDVSHIRSDLDERLAPPDAQPLADTLQPIDSPSLLGRIEAWFSNAFSSLKDGTNAVRAVTQQGAMDTITTWLNAKVESALTLMAIFLVEVFVMPTLLGYALYRGLRAIIAAIFS
jgi:hypothetical protein